MNNTKYTNISKEIIGTIFGHDRESLFREAGNLQLYSSSFSLESLSLLLSLSSAARHVAFQQNFQVHIHYQVSLFPSKIVIVSFYAAFRSDSCNTGFVSMAWKYSFSEQSKTRWAGVILLYSFTNLIAFIYSFLYLSISIFLKTRRKQEYLNVHLKWS